jgi:hypothetical protein
VSVSLTDEGKPGYAKMKALDTVDGEAVKSFAGKSVSKGSEIRTDGLNIYRPLAKCGYSLVRKVYDPKKQPEHLHWTHIVISNAKAFLEGTFHGLDAFHLQRYWDEFCFRFNRRYFKPGQLFNRVLNSCILAGKVTAHELIG